jgi:hypothetical protein
MRVTAEIGQHLLRAAAGRFGIDHPRDPPQLIEVAAEGSGFGECREFSEQAELAGRERGIEFSEEQPAEQAGEHAHRQKEAGATGDPACAVERRAAARHDAVNRRMMVERLPQVWSTATRPISAPRCFGSAFTFARKKASARVDLSPALSVLRKLGLSSSPWLLRGETGTSFMRMS